MFCHHKSVLPGFTQKRRLPRIFRFLRMQRDKGEHPSTVARAILCRLTTIWLSKTFAIVFANVIAEIAKENIFREARKGFSLLQCLWNDGRLQTRIFNGVGKLNVSLQLYCWAILWESRFYFRFARFYARFNFWCANFDSFSWRVCLPSRVQLKITRASKNTRTSKHTHQLNESKLAHRKLNLA